MKNPLLTFTTLVYVMCMGGVQSNNLFTNSRVNLYTDNYWDKGGNLIGTTETGLSTTNSALASIVDGTIETAYAGEGYCHESSQSGQIINFTISNFGTLSLRSIVFLLGGTTSSISGFSYKIDIWYAGSLIS